MRRMDVREVGVASRLRDSSQYLGRLSNQIRGDEEQEHVLTPQRLQPEALHLRRDVIVCRRCMVVPLDEMDDILHGQHPRET